MTNAMMTNAELAEIDARANAATAGPWIVRGPNGRSSVWTETPCKIATVEAPDMIPPFQRAAINSNCEFIAAARSDVPALVAENRRLRALVAYICAIDKATSLAVMRYLGSDAASLVREVESVATMGVEIATGAGR